MSNTYEGLAALAERGELAVKPDTVRRGEEARADARRAMMEATGATTHQDAMRLALGRPPLGAKRGPSPVVRARVSRSSRTA